MITGKTSEEYFALEMDSSSSLKVFAQNKRKYYKKYVSKEKIEEEEDSKASVVGRLVETQLLEPELFDSRFYLSASTKSLTGKMGDFVNALVNITLENTNESGEVTKTFEERATEARTIAQFDWKLPVILDKFVGKDPEILYKELLQVKSKGLAVVTLNDVQNADRVVNELKYNEFTAPIINQLSGGQIDVRNQYQIEGYEVDGLKLKSMMDKLIINHKNKTIQVYDLKCVWSVENFYTEYYLYRLAYIQAYLYKQACYEIKEREGLDYYDVLEPKFIVCDSINYYAPLIYTLTPDNIEDAYNGFLHRGKQYPGVKQIILDLKWAKENNIWNISRINYENNGVVNIKG